MPALIVPILVGIPVLFVGGYYLVKVMANGQVPSHAASKKARATRCARRAFLSGLR